MLCTKSQQDDSSSLRDLELGFPNPCSSVMGHQNRCHHPDLWVGALHVSETIHSENDVRFKKFPSGRPSYNGFVKEYFKENMPKEECVEFVKKTVFHAMNHDGSSGGVCRIGIITKEGVERRVFFLPHDGVTLEPQATPMSISA